jgi:hypothetical protein
MVVITACSKKDSPSNCVSLSSKMSSAASTYASSPTSANCSAYVQTIRDYANGCSVLTASEKQSLETSINSMSCK